MIRILKLEVNEQFEPIYARSFGRLRGKFLCKEVVLNGANGAGVKRAPLFWIDWVSVYVRRERSCGLVGVARWASFDVDAKSFGLEAFYGGEVGGKVI